MGETSTQRDFDMDDGAEILAETGLKGVYEQSWGAVIGINDYPQNKLQYAVADAAAIAETLICRHGFLPQNVFLILDRPDKLPDKLSLWLAQIKPALRYFRDEATRDNIQEVLYTLLPNCAGPDDRVLVYFAGHGQPRKIAGASAYAAKPYLVPVDGIAGRWQSFLDLQEVIKQGDFTPAKHIFYLLDACCCGLAGVRSAEQPTRYEKDLIQRKARQCLSAGTAEQYVADAGPEGHSLFTWQILQALSGATTMGGDGVLSASKLISYVKEHVGQAQVSAQTPDGFSLVGHESGDFVFSAPKVPLTLEERARLARLLVDAGQRLDESSAVALGARLWQGIIAAQPADSQQALVAEREQGRAQLILGSAVEAGGALAAAGLRDDAEAIFLRGATCLGRGAHAEATAELSRLVSEHPDHPFAGWARCAIEAQQQQGTRHVLLIGVESHPKYPEVHLSGCLADVNALEQTFRTLGCAVRTLQEAQATTEAVRGTLREYVKTLRPEDSFVFYFCGTGALVNLSSEELAIYGTYDMDLEHTELCLSETDVDNLVRMIPAEDKVVITDSCHLANKEGVGLSGYRFLSGCGRQQTACELRTPEGTQRGMFSYALQRSLEQLGNVPMEILFRSIKERVEQHKMSQTPEYWGQGELPLLSKSAVRAHAIMRLVLGPTASLSVAELKGFAAWLEERRGVDMEPLRLAVGQALRARGQHQAALATLQGVKLLEAMVARIQLQLYAGQLPDDLASWQQLCTADAIESMEGPVSAALAALEPVLAVVRRGSRRALLVGVSDPDATTPWVANPHDTLLALRDALTARCGFAADCIEVCIDPAGPALLDAFARLSIQAAEQPAFFLYCGPGDDATELGPAGGNQPGSHLSLSELGTRAVGCTDLTGAIFITSRHGVYRANSGPLPPEPRRQTQELSAPWKVLLTGQPTAIIHRDFGDVEVEKPPDLPGFVQALTQHGNARLSAREWLAQAGTPPGVMIRGSEDTPLFMNAQPYQRAQELLAQCEQEPLRRTAALLSKLAEQRQLAPQALLHLGVVQSALQEHELALLNIDAAIDRFRAEAPGEAENIDEPRGIVRWPEAHYQRGRILLAAGRYPEAEGELGTAVRQWDGKNARAHYYRAKAIRRLIEMDLARQAQEALRLYVQLGAPLGMDDEIRNLLGSR